MIKTHFILINFYGLVITKNQDVGYWISDPTTRVGRRLALLSNNIKFKEFNINNNDEKV